MTSNRSSAAHRPGLIHVGLVTDEPIRLTGLASIFEQPIGDDQVRCVPVTGTMRELLANHTLNYLVVDLSSPVSGLQAIESVRRTRPDVRLIVIGPSGDEELVLRSIIAGARAYLDMREDPQLVRKAIEVVIEGSIWAPRRLLSKLIDRLLKINETSVSAVLPQLTAREHQVLELIMLAQSNREIALRLGIEERTVRAHLARLMRKAGVDNRIKLSMSARTMFQLSEKHVDASGQFD